MWPDIKQEELREGQILEDGQILGDGQIIKWWARYWRWLDTGDGQIPERWPDIRIGQITWMAR